MNRIEVAAALQVSRGQIDVLDGVSGVQVISCTPTVALAATVAALVVTTFGGGYVADDQPGSDSGEPVALMSNDLIGAARAAQAGR